MAADTWLSRKNKQNLQNRGDYGIRVARPGYDASNCAQNQLIFNSGWPILQLMAVVDFTSGTTSTSYTKNTRVEYSVGHYESGAFMPESTTMTTTSEQVSSVPSGLPSSQARHDYFFGGVFVNKKYVKKQQEDYTLYDGGSTTESGTLPSGKNYIRETVTTYTKDTFVTTRHRLGFTPLCILSSSFLGGDSNHALLFSVDITKDVDYPYTEAATPLIRPVHDYGMKSTSIFGSKVPGLCTNMFSKLVQAVKTTESSTYNDGENDAVVWSPIAGDELPSNIKDVLFPYEFYAYSGDGVKTQDGGEFYQRISPTYISSSASSGTYMNKAYAVRTSGQDTVKDSVLVVLRSPMVSPEYEEI
jgi:hypothetical protein